MIKKILQEISENFKHLSETSSVSIEEATRLILDALNNWNKIMFCGNGGSAADSQHLSAELLGRYRKNRPALASIALTTDTSTITAIANDFGYDEIFSRQIEGFGKKGDILYAISTSGNSKNVKNAINIAKKSDIKVIGVTGESGGLMSSLCDIIIKVPANKPDRIQEMHIAVGQIICGIIEDNFFPDL